MSSIPTLTKQLFKDTVCVTISPLAIRAVDEPHLKYIHRDAV